MKEFYFSYYFDGEYRSHVVRADLFSKAWKCFCKWCLKNEEEKSMIEILNDYSVREVVNGVAQGFVTKRVNENSFDRLNRALKGEFNLFF